MGCLLAKQPGPAPSTPPALTTAPIASTSCFEHVAKALQLLATLSDLCVPVPQLRPDGLVGPDPAFTQQLIDAVNMVLLAVAGPEAKATVQGAGTVEGVQGALDRAAMVPAALRALTLVLSAQAPGGDRGSSSGDVDWDLVSEAAFSRPRGGVLLDVAFEATHTLVAAVRAALCGPAGGDAVYRLAFSAGGAMEILSSMSASPLFYQCLMLRDPHGGLPLRLILACLSLHDAPLAAPPFRRVASSPGNGSASRPVLTPTQPPYLTAKGAGAAELLAARGFALLVVLGECTAPAYLDALAADAATRVLSEQVVGRAAGYVGQVLLRPVVGKFPAGEGEGQMAINVLRAAELLSDDSNFRMTLISGLTPTLAQLLGHTDPEAFASLWCVGADAVALHVQDSILVNSASPAARQAVKVYAAAAKALFGPSSGRNGEWLPLRWGIWFASCTGAGSAWA